MYDDLFQNLPTSALRIISMCKGDVLFRQGQATTGMYHVLAGAVVLQRTTLDGEVMTLHRASAGQMFAEASIFSDTYHCDAVCTGDGAVRLIAKAYVRDMLRSHPDFAEGFTRHLAKQAQSYRQLFEILAIRAASARVYAAVEAGYLQGTVPALASSIHLTPEACYRALTVLRKEGRLTRTGRGRYVIAGGPDA